MMLSFMMFIALCVIICFPFALSRAAKKAEIAEREERRRRMPPPMAVRLLKGVAFAIAAMLETKPQVTRSNTRVLDLELPKKPDVPMSQTVGKALFITGVLVLLAFLALTLTGGSK